MSSDFDSPAPTAGSLRESTWTTPVVLAGLCVLLIWRSTTLIHCDWLAALPWWLLFVVTCVIPELFLLIYPLVTRKQPQPSVFRLPGLKRLLTEAAIAVPIILGSLVLIAIVELAVVQLWPGKTLVPEVYDRMAKSTGTPFIYGFLLTSFLYAPIAEEVFFRGFLFNAFRKRMPLFFAIPVASLVFGFGHFFEFRQAIAAALLGVLLTLVYYWRQTIFAPIFVHAGYNGLWAAGMLLAMYANANAPVLGVMSQQTAENCVIGAVVPGSPAESAGLLPGDTITHVNDYPITDFQNLIDTVSYFEAGDAVVVAVDRNGEGRQIEVVLAPRSALSP